MCSFSTIKSHFLRVGGFCFGVHVCGCVKFPYMYSLLHWFRNYFFKWFVSFSFEKCSILIPLMLKISICESKTTSEWNNYWLLIFFLFCSFQFLNNEHVLLSWSEKIHIACIFFAVFPAFWKSPILYDHVPTLTELMEKIALREITQTYESLKPAD